MSNCKNCKHWQRAASAENDEPLRIGTCSVNSLYLNYYDDTDEALSKIALGAFAGDNFYADEDFGCILFEGMETDNITMADLDELANSAEPGQSVFILTPRKGHAVKIGKGLAYKEDGYALFETEAYAIQFISEESANIVRHGPDATFEDAGPVGLTEVHVSMLLTSNREPNHIYVDSL